MENFDEQAPQSTPATPASSARESFSLVQNENPDAYAKTLGLSDKTGVPVDVVKRNQATVENNHWLDSTDFDGMARQTPRLTGWLQNPDNAAVAKDDLEALSQVEKDIDAHGYGERLWKGLASAAVTTGGTLTQMPAAILNTVNTAIYSPLGVDSRRYLLTTETQAAKDARDIAQELSVPSADMVDAFSLVGQGKFDLAAKSILSSQLESTLPSIATMAAMTAAGQPEFGLGLMGVQSGTQAYNQAELKGVSPEARMSHAVTSGGAEVLFESMSFGTAGWMKRIAENMGKKFGTTATAEFMKHAVKEMSHAFFGEASEEMMTEAVQATSEYLTGTDPKALDNFARRLLNAGIAGGIGGGLGSSAEITGLATRDAIDWTQRRAAVKQAQQLYLAMGASAEASKLRERLPEKHKEFLQAALKGGSTENIFIPIKAFLNYAQENKLNPAQSMMELGLLDKYNTAVETGMDIRVPLAQWVSAVVPTPHYKGLVNDIKLTENAMTANQLAAAQAEAKATAQAHADAHPDDTALVAKDLEAQLVKAGVNASDAKTQAKLGSLLVAGRAAEESKQQGRPVSPWEFFKSQPINIGTEMTPEQRRQNYHERGIGTFQLPGESAASFLNWRTGNMTEAERQAVALTDPTTGLLNERARNLTNVDTHSGHLSFGGVKWINDKISHDAANEVYRVVAAALEKARPGSFKVAGDFQFQMNEGENPADIEAAVKANLPDAVTIDGKTYDLTQLPIVATYGTDARSAADAADLVKEQRVKEGTYPDRAADAMGMTPTEKQGVKAEKVKANIPAEMAAEVAKGDKYHAQAFIREDDGMMNLAAESLMPEKAFVVHADLDHLGKTNKDLALFGDKEAARKAGDQILADTSRTFLRLLADPKYADKIDAFHISGDEYHFQSDDFALLQEYLKLAEESLNAPLRLDLGDGKVFLKPNITASFGIGVDHADAERAQNENKQQRETQRATHGWRLAEGGSVSSGPLDHSGVHASRRASGSADSRSQGANEVKTLPAEYEQKAQTETPEFKAWSGGSHLVSPDKAPKYRFETGKPVTVEAFHGTPEGGFEAFDPYTVGQNTSTPSDGFYFTESDRNAATYHGGRSEARIVPNQAAFDEGNTQKGSYHVYVTFKNPLVVDFKGRNWDGMNQKGKYDGFEGMNDQVNSAIQEGHDGLIAKNVTDEGRHGDGYNWGQLTYVAFKPTQIKSAIGNRGTFDSANPNILFQSASDQPRLSALHNLTAENLAYADEMGGLAVPSIAVVPQSVEAPSGFGEITLIGGKSLGDPKQVPAFDADAYSPRFPKAEYAKAKTKDLQRVSRALLPFEKLFDDHSPRQVWDDMANGKPDAAISTIIRSDAAKAAFLKERLGVEAAPEMRDAKVSSYMDKQLSDELNRMEYFGPNDMELRKKFSDAVKAAFEREANRLVKEEGYTKKEAKSVLDVSKESNFDEDGIVHWGYTDKFLRDAKRFGTKEISSLATSEALDKAIAGHEQEFKKWAEDLVLPAHGEPMLTVNGRKVSYTLGNIVDVMTGRVKGREKTMTEGAGKTRAVAAKRFSDLEKMRKAAADNVMPAEKVAEAREKTDKLLEVYRDAALEMKNRQERKLGYAQADTWDTLDASMRVIQRWAKMARTEDNFVKALRAEGFYADESDKVTELGFKAAEAFIKAPVPYFEAKPQRAVDLSEFPGAVVPDGTDQATLEILNKNGIEVSTYDPSKPESRGAAVDALRSKLAEQGKDTLFQPAYHGTPHKFDKFTLAHIGTGEGAQAYGWGLYFASEKAVADYYRETTAGALTTIDLRIGKFDVVKGEDFKDYSPKNNTPYEQAKASIIEDLLIDQAAFEAEFSTGGEKAVKAHALKVIDEHIQRWTDENYADGIAGAKQFRAEVEKYGVKMKAEKPGFTMTVDIPEDSELLDYDKPLSEQPEGVREKLAKAGFTREPIEDLRGQVISLFIKMARTPGVVQWAKDAIREDKKNVMQAKSAKEILKLLHDARDNYGIDPQGIFSKSWNDYTVAANRAEMDQAGGALYNEIQQLKGSPEAASRFLDSIGIPGLRYLDGNSRRAGDGHHNYVIWNEEAIKTRTELEQAQASDSARGKITFKQQETIIELFKAKNLSTFSHEMGHYLLETMQKQSLSPAASPQLQQDMAAVYSYLGMTPGERIPVEAHEKFADSFLKYLEEGKAPTKELQGMFSRIRVWLLSLWNNGREYWGHIELSPEIKAVFDRSLASDQAIEASQAAYGFSDPMNLQSEEYQKAVADANAEAKELLFQKVIRSFNEQKAAWWKQQEEGVRALVESELKKNPAYEIASVLATGKRLDGTTVENAPKLSRASVAPAMRDGMPRGIFTDEGGVDMNTLAGMYGFESGPRLALALKGLVPFEREATRQTSQRMAEMYPELLTSQDLPEEIKTSIHNENRSKALELAMNILWDQRPVVVKQAIRDVAKRPPSMADTKANAAAIVGGLLVSDLKDAPFLRAEVAAAKESGVLLAKGDIEGAYQAKAKEALNHEIVRAIKDAKAVQKKLEKLSDKFFGNDEKMGKARDMNIVNAGRTILALYSLGGKQDVPAETYLDKLKRYDPLAYSTMAVLVNNAVPEAKPYTTIPYSELAMLSENMNTMWKLSKSSAQIQVRGQVELKEDAIAEMTAAFPTVEPVGYIKHQPFWKNTKQTMLSLRAGLRRVESWADAMGPSFKKYLYEPVSEAVNHYRVAKVEFTKKHMALAAKLDPVKAEVIMSPELNQDFANRGEVIMALLHTGNESNLSKLIRGRGWGSERADGTLDTSRWDAFIKRMASEGIITKSDMDYVQGVWDLLEEIKPLAQQAHKSLYGYYFNEVTRRPTVTPWGTYAGGYMPAVVDFTHPNASAKVQQDAEKEVFDQSQNSFMFPTTGKGFTKSRVDAYAGPLSLEPKLIGSHIDKVLRFAYIQKSVSQVYRLTRDKGFQESMKQVDPTVIPEMIVPFLQRAASQRVSEPGGWKMFDAPARYLRATAGMAAMVGNVTNTIQQLTGFGLSALKVQPRHLVRGLVTFTQGPGKMAEDIAEKSEFMRTRTVTQAMEVQQEINNILVPQSEMETVRDFAKKHAYFMQQITQNIVDLTTWQGAYNQAIEQGQPEDAAIREADSAIRLTQGSFNAEDVSRFETGSPFTRMFTMFYSYFNMQANLLGTEFSKVSRDMGYDTKKGAGRAFYVYAMGFALPAIMSELLYMAAKGQAGDGDDDWMDEALTVMFGSQLKQLPSFIPMLSPIVNTAVGAWTDSTWDDNMRVSPVIQALEATVKAPYDIYKVATEGKRQNKALRDGLTAVTMFSGLPVAWMAKPLGYLSDVQQGEANPTGPVDYTRGLLTGKK